MSGIPPNQCYICYQAYNNERVPLILTTCGHTYCKECLLLVLNRDTKEIVCPECKQITPITDIDLLNLPKNRSLLNLIIYNEQINYSKKIQKESSLKNNFEDDPKDKSVQNKILLEKYFEKYNEVINKLEETYKAILNEHSYLNEISEVLIIKEIDDVLDSFIEVINDHRLNLRKKIKAEFEKVNLIKNFCNSISFLRTRLNSYIKFFNSKSENLKENDIVIGSINNNERDTMNINFTINEVNNVENTIKICQKEFDLKINDTLINIQNEAENIVIEEKEISLNTNDQNIEFKLNKINQSQRKYDHKEDALINDDNNIIEQETKAQEEHIMYEANNINAINDINKSCGSTKNIGNNTENTNLNLKNIQSKRICNKETNSNPNNITNINNLRDDNKTNNCYNDFEISFLKNNIIKSTDGDTINESDLSALENEIKYSELYYLTLKHFTKEIYNPCKFFYINKFQIEKLCDDLRKMLFKVCDYDENIVKYKIQDLNNFEEKKFIKEIQESCQTSNNAKLKFLFTHFRINPNFIYSDVLDQITNQQGPSEHLSSNSLGLQISNSNNFYHNLNNLSANNHNTFSSLNIFDPITARRNINNPNRNIASRYNSNILNNSNAKDKVFNFYTYLKGFKDKGELNDLLRFLVDEYDYIPLKIEYDSNFDLKLIREFDWKMELGLL